MALKDEIKQMQDERQKIATWSFIGGVAVFVLSKFLGKKDFDTSLIHGVGGGVFFFVLQKYVHKH